MVSGSFPDLVVRGEGAAMDLRETSEYPDPVSSFQFLVSSLESLPGSVGALHSAGSL